MRKTNKILVGKMGRNSPKLDVAVSVLLNVPESHHGVDVVVHHRGVLPQFLYCSRMILVPLLLLFQESSMFCLRILDAEDGVVGAVEEGAGLVVVVVRESIRGVGVPSCIKLGLGPGPWISGIPARTKRRVCPLVILAFWPRLLCRLMWLSMSNPRVPKDSGVVVAVM